MKIHTLAGLALACVVLVACSTTDTSTWPDPKTVTAYGRGLEMTAAALCPSVPACKSNPKLLNDADSALDLALNGYAEAYATGSVTQALLDNLTAAEADILKIIADLKGGKH